MNRGRVAACHAGMLFLFGVAIHSGAQEQEPIPPTFQDAAGHKCAQGLGVTVCPVVASVRGVPAIDPSRPRNVLMEYCVSADGRAEDVTVVKSSGNARTDKALRDWWSSTRFKPGTVDGGPARICGVFVTWNSKPPG